jgi:hypothetical protein
MIRSAIGVLLSVYQTQVAICEGLLLPSLGSEVASTDEYAGRRFDLCV